MRATIAGALAITLAAGMAESIAATRLSPNEIQSAFFNGQPFTSTAGSTKYKMVFASDGKMTREPVGKRGVKSEGSWKLSKDGYCTSWKAHRQKCFVVVAGGKNKWSVMTGKTLAATWSK